MNDATKAELDYIVDTLSGGDGGVGYAKFQALIEEMDRQYNEVGGRAGYDAGQVLNVMTQFKKLIEIAQES